MRDSNYSKKQAPALDPLFSTEGAFTRAAIYAAIGRATRRRRDQLELHGQLLKLLLVVDEGLADGLRVLHEIRPLQFPPPPPPPGRVLQLVPDGDAS